VVQYVNEGLSDEAVLQSCFAMGHRPSQSEIYMWNEFMFKRGWHDDAFQTLKQLKREEGLTARSEIQTIFQLIDVAEGRAPHTKPLRWLVSRPNILNRGWPASSTVTATRRAIAFNGGWH